MYKFKLNFCCVLAWTHIHSLSMTLRQLKGTNTNTNININTNTYTFAHKSTQLNPNMASYGKKQSYIFHGRRKFKIKATNSVKKGLATTRTTYTFGWCVDLFKKRKTCFSSALQCDEEFILFILILGNIWTLIFHQWIIIIFFTKSVMC